MDLAAWLMMLWMLLVEIPSENKVSCCLDMLIKEVSQMFAGPGGTLMGTSNANNLDRIRIFNNYQAPSIDQIEDEEDLEGKLYSEEDYDSSDDYYGGGSNHFNTDVRRNRKGDKEHSGRRDRESNSAGIVRYKARDENKNEDRQHRIANKRDSKSSAKKESEKENLKDATRLKVISKIRRAKLPEATKGRSARTRDPLGLIQVKPLPDPTQSLYNLEPKTTAYNSKVYKPNVYEDSDEDSMSFQTRDDTRNRVRTGKVNQPIIEMMTNILDTIQLTSKHDYKRAKEKELRDNAREALQKLHRH